MRLGLHQLVVVQTSELSALSSCFKTLLPCGCELLYGWGEEDVEGLTLFAVDLVVHLDMKIVEEGLVGD
ncbi:hypothetical protein I6B53_02255 [Schaalia sp. 19OD2882]|uniref:hypothetical protein n=1 Tax=Schaalia sp. 19OD2882 TaxID=2794089 RepID=UPI001C1EE037|nr:hypothetical protein [Schaalia sp. 19OD2882]QWW19956.1 hypothetical protein I6B53_02255 [Schaalia sp. 19OD2882]